MQGVTWSRQSMHLQRGRFLKAVNNSQFPSSCIYPIDLILTILILLYWFFQTGLALPERICDLSLPTLALTIIVIRLEKSTAIAPRKCCLSSTRQIKTSFLLHWHSSYHCSKHIYSHPTATVGSGSNCLPTLTSQESERTSIRSYVKFRVHTARYLSCFARLPLQWLSLRPRLRLGDALVGRLILARHPPLLSPYLYLLKECTAQKRLSRNIEEAGVLTYELSVECRTLRPFSTHESQVKTTSYGLKSTLFNRLDVCDRLGAVQALGWGGVTWQRSCRIMYAVENIGVCTNFQWTIIFFSVRDHLPRWTLNIFSISSQLFLFRKQVSAGTRRASIRRNVRSVSTGGIWPKE